MAAPSETALRRAATPQSSPGGPLSRQIGKLQCVCTDICEPNADKGENLEQHHPPSALNAGQSAIMLATAYPEATNKGGRGHAKPVELSTVDKSDLSRARAICKLGRGSKLEHYGRGRDYRPSSVLAFSHRPALGP